MAHMDVVEARREDWSRDPFTARRGGRLFLRPRHARRQAGRHRDHHRFAAPARRGLPAQPRHHRPVHRRRGDRRAAAPNSPPTSGSTSRTIDFALNGDGGGGAFLEDGTLLGFGIQTAEKTYQSYTLTATNPGGHSSRPRPDNAIYALAHTLGAARSGTASSRCRTRPPAAISRTALRTAEPALAAAIRRWLADPADGAAADLVEASPTEVGLTRTRCVATRLEGGHADNALPQLARATVNCRIFPGVDPAARAGRSCAASPRPTRSPSSRSTSPGRPTPRRCGEDVVGGLYRGGARPPSRRRRSSPT